MKQVGSLFAEKALCSRAEPPHRSALTIDEASIGNDDPDVAIDVDDLDWLLRPANRLEGTEPLMRRALAMCLRSGAMPGTLTRTARR